MLSINHRLLTAALLGALVLTACGGAQADDAVDTAPVTTSPVEEDPADDPTEDEVPADGAAPSEEPTDTDPSEEEVPTEDAPSEEPEDDAGEDTDTTAPADEAAVECEPGDERRAPVEVDAMPEEVEALRDLLLDAALRCDEQLLRTAIDESSMFTFSFGGGDDAIGFWDDLQQAGETPYRTLAELLLTTPALADGEVAWVWPAVQTGRPEARTPALLAELDRVDPALREQVASGESYLGPRVGISPDGEWRFYVSGD